MPSQKQLQRKIADLEDERDELQDQLDAISDILQEGGDEDEEDVEGED
jgi:small-conductance mechanosensitive channel